MKTQGGIPAGTGGWRRGVYTKSRMFRIRNKKATLHLSGLSGLAHGLKADNNKFYPGIIECLLDNLIRPRQHVGRNRQTDLLCCLEIDHQLELSRLLDRQVGGLGSLQDSVH